MSVDQAAVREQQKFIIDSMRYPYTRKDVFQKYDSGALNDARIREIFRRRKERILREMGGSQEGDNPILKSRKVTSCCITLEGRA